MVSPASTVASSISELWAAELQMALEKYLRYVNVFNTKYEGEIDRQGSSVRITTVADVPIGDYARSTDISLNNLTTTDQNLVITQAKSYGFFWDALDQKQTATKGLMQEAVRRAAYNMRNLMDQFAATTLENGVQSANKLPDATSVGTGAGDDDPFKILVRLAQKLEENNVDENDRYVVIPPWYAAELKIDPRRSSFGTPENISQYGQGLMGIETVSGLKVWVSNNVPTTNEVSTTGQFSIIAGQKDSATWATQLLWFAVKDNPYRNGDNWLGANAYGAQVTRPYGLASVLCTQASV